MIISVAPFYTTRPRANLFEEGLLCSRICAAWPVVFTFNDTGADAVFIKNKGGTHISMNVLNINFFSCQTPEFFDDFMLLPERRSIGSLFSGKIFCRCTELHDADQLMTVLQAPYYDPKITGSAVQPECWL
jgi:hypothetical protein